MNYGFNIASAGVLTAMHRQDVASNNLANVETVGFKPDMATTIPRAAARIEDGLANMPSNSLLEKLGAGVLLAPSRTTFRQGSLQQTGNDLDVAIRGNGFFQVSTTDNATGAEGVGLTRDGRFTLDDRGRLVTVTDGRRVLGQGDRPITLIPGELVTIGSDGSISQGGQEIARLALVEVPDPSRLRKQGAGLFTADAQTLAQRRPADGDIVQRSVEHSGVDAIGAMMQVQSAANAVSASTRVAQICDELMGRAINSLGRVS